MACQPFSAPSGKRHERIPGRNPHEARCLAFKRSAAEERVQRAVSSRGMFPRFRGSVPEQTVARSRLL